MTMRIKRPLLLFFVVAALLTAGGLYYAATQADAAVVYYQARCTGPDGHYGAKHTDYETYNGVWKFLVPWCPSGYQHAGDRFIVAHSSSGWIIPAF